MSISMHTYFFLHVFYGDSNPKQCTVWWAGSNILRYRVSVCTQPHAGFPGNITISDFSKMKSGAYLFDCKIGMMSLFTK